ncbi:MULTISPECIES: hypothetical protein [Acidiphilium]|uniref:hypothetical protein n=1 Tax=Acidiphilium TaxID=522 RepID=UPI000BD9BFC7|nr:MULTISPECIES: hypothetical protein [Acidiphilium]OZB24109.1 MAG: hypothetical protein B7X49_15170 [Acidiphilium sp. 34-64-41]HQT84350.1 hypothetical protein [Acidiphilium rubrum]
MRTAPTPLTISLLDRFALIMAMLAEIVVNQGHAQHLPGSRIIAIWQRLTSIAARFARAVLRGPTPSRKRLTPAKPNLAKRPSLPDGFGWLPRVFPGTHDMPAAVTYPAQQLRDLLADPTMAELIETNPAIGRILRPLFEALGIERPTILAIPQPTAREPAHHEPEPPPATPPSVPHTAWLTAWLTAWMPGTSENHDGRTSSDTEPAAPLQLFYC